MVTNWRANFWRTCQLFPKTGPLGKRKLWVFRMGWGSRVTSWIGAIQQWLHDAETGGHGCFAASWFMSPTKNKGLTGSHIFNDDFLPTKSELKRSYSLEGVNPWRSRLSKNSPCFFVVGETWDYTPQSDVFSALFHSFAELSNHLNGGDTRDFKWVISFERHCPELNIMHFGAVSEPNWESYTEARWWWNFKYFDYVHPEILGEDEPILKFAYCSKQVGEKPPTSCFFAVDPAIIWVHTHFWSNISFFSDHFYSFLTCFNGLFSRWAQDTWGASYDNGKSTYPPRN